MDINVNMNKIKNNINGANSINNMGGMGRRGDMDMNMGNVNGRAGDDNLAGMSAGNRRNRTRYSSGLMDYDMDMSAMNSMNKISPDGAANHWFWNDEDY